jgi:hypothetical protein
MKKHLILVAAFAGLVGCGTVTTTDAGVDAGTMMDGGSDAGVTLDLTTDIKIFAYLEGKTMVMTGADIPSSPNGFNENINFGAATQCYHKTSIAVLAGNFNVTSDLGQFNSIPDAGVAGMCNRAVKTTTQTFSSTTILIENVKNNAECFDFTATYVGFKQEGRGKISPDGKTVTLELFFAATGHRCADGAVGATGVKLATSAGAVPFAGDAKQVYRVQ